MRRQDRRVLLTLEQLEDRLVPAGNIQVNLVGNLIEVLGDSSSNGLEITKGATADEVAFRGLHGTKINNASDVLVLNVAGGIDNLSVDLGNGNDELVIANRSAADPKWPFNLSAAFQSNLPIQGDVYILAGRGEDIVQLRAVDIGGNLRLLLRQDRDVAVLESVNVAQDLAIDGGLRADLVLLRSVQVTGQSSILTQSGHDSVGLFNSVFVSNVLVHLSSGEDIISAEGNTFADLSLIGGRGNNQMTVEFATSNTIGGQFQSSQLQESLAKLAEVKYGYEGNIAPEFWGRLTPAWILAEVGRQQTPIAINTASVVPANLPTLNFDYQDATNLLFNNKGTGIEVKYPAGSKITVDGHDYALVEFHFHTPSEHTVDGRAFPMEMHLVHSDAAGNLLVVGVLYKDGAANSAYDALVSSLPNQQQKTTIAGPFNPESLLPTDRNYFAYSGSLTTPPASELVSFGILTQAVELSAAQIQGFETAIGVSNERPLLPTNERVVFVSAGVIG